MPIERPSMAEQQQTTNPKTGKIERVFVNLEAVYPNPDDPKQEFSFEELRAQSRGWSNRDWAAERKQVQQKCSLESAVQAELPPSDAHRPNELATDHNQMEPISQSTVEQLIETAPAEDVTQGTRARKSKRMKVMEVKGETQTSNT